jgi:hypothetical protein
MITYTIKSYDVNAYTGKDQDIRLGITDDTNTYRGYILFKENISNGPNYILHPNGIVNAFMPMEKFSIILDILRNEKPVRFIINQQANMASIAIGNEPTGEGE